MERHALALNLLTGYYFVTAFDLLAGSLDSDKTSFSNSIGN